jgi:hypothetical protein
MAKKVTISSSSIDRHGDYLGEILPTAIEMINGNSKMRMLLNHRRDLPPIGYWDNAELVFDEVANVNLVKAEEKFFGEKQALAWDSTIIQIRPENAISLKNRNKYIQSLVVSVDKNNLGSFEEHGKLGEEIKAISQQEIDFEMHSRKSSLTDPELIIKLAPTVMVLYPLFQPFLKKMGEKIAEDMANDVYQYSKTKIREFQKYIFKVIRIARNRSIPRDKALTTIFEIPGHPYIELYAKTDDADLVSKALSERKMGLIYSEISRLAKFLTIEEIHFSLSEKGSWKFTYLVTNDGDIVGTKKSFDSRDKLHKKILLNSTIGYSMSGEGVKYDKG